MTRKIFIFHNCLKLVITFPRNHLKSFLEKLALNEVQHASNCKFSLNYANQDSARECVMVKADFLRVGTCLKPFQMGHRVFVRVRPSTYPSIHISVPYVHLSVHPNVLPYSCVCSSIHVFVCPYCCPSILLSVLIAVCPHFHPSFLGSGPKEPMSCKTQSVRPSFHPPRWPLRPQILTLRLD